MNYARSVITYGAVFSLIGLLVLFFGGLFLSDGAAPPGPRAEWGGTPSAAPAQAGFLLAAFCLGLGLLAASWARASWEETIAVLVICAGGLWVLSPSGLEGLCRLLWQIDWLWREALRPGPDPGWSAALPMLSSCT